MSRDETPGRDALERALERWRRARAGGPAIHRRGDPSGDPSASHPASSGQGPGQGLAELARRLDDGGCAYGRVSAARIEHLTRAYDRLETKLNAVLMAVVGTFLSTLASLLLYVVRGSGH